MRLQLLGLTAFLAVSIPFALRAQQQGCKPTVVGYLDILPLTSRIFHNQRSLRVWLPPGYGDASNATKKYKVLYMLDGQSVFDTCTAFMHEEMRADETLTELITAGKIVPIIVVGVDNGSPDEREGRNNAIGGMGRGSTFLIPTPCLIHR